MCETVALLMPNAREFRSSVERRYNKTHAWRLVLRRGVTDADSRGKVHFAWPALDFCG